MRVASESVLKRLRATPAAMLRAGCVALLVCVSGCGGGSDGGAPPPSSTPTPAPAPAPGTTQPPLAPATLVLGTALSIDSGASGNPVSLRVVRSANGDGFAVWQASRTEDVTHLPSGLWANRYRAATDAWGSPINIETGGAMGVGEFDLTVDASGNAVVAWKLMPADPNTELGRVMSARFDAGAGAWATPVVLNTNSSQPRVASDATGAVLAVYVARVPSSPACARSCVKGRFFDPASGTWQPEAVIEQNHTGNSASAQPAALLDGSGNALVGFFTSILSGFEEHIVASNYHSRGTGDWGQLPPDGPNILGVVPGSFGFHQNLQLAASTDGNFLAAWQNSESAAQGFFDIAIARFTSRTRTWTENQTLVPGSVEQNVELQRIGSDAGGNVHLMWTEWDGMRTVLKAARLDPGAASCSAVQSIDRAVGGSAYRADLAVDPLGDAIAIWDRIDGGGSEARSDIAINRFDRATGAWTKAVLVEAQPDIAFSSRRPRASASGGQALLGWIQPEGGANRVKALLQPLANTPSQ